MRPQPIETKPSALMPETQVMQIIETETVRLIGYGDFADLRHQIASRLFGEMLQRATPVVKEYHSDLFHDAEWLRERIIGRVCSEQFAYVVRPSGTHLGIQAEYALRPSLWQRGSRAYIVTLTEDESESQTWYVRFDLIKQD